MWNGQDTVEVKAPAWVLATGYGNKPVLPKDRGAQQLHRNTKDLLNQDRPKLGDTRLAAPHDLFDAVRRRDEATGLNEGTRPVFQERRWA